MIKVKDVLKLLSEKFPIEDASDFDNVGLLIGDGEAEVKGVLCSLDATLDAVKKAEQKGANLIVTHHPVIFDGIKTVLCDSVVYEIIRNNISVISMHTNLDVGIGGVNDILCNRLGLNNVKKLMMSDGYVLNSAETDISSPDSLAEEIKSRLNFSVRYVAGRHIKKLLVCSGSGGNFIEETLRLNFDALITADVKHNQFVFAKNHGISLFDAGHFATEDVCVEPLAELVKENFANLEISVYNDTYISYI